MTLLDMLTQANNGGLVDQIAGQLGVDPAVVRQGMTQLSPAVQRGLQRNAQQGGGLDSLFEALGAAQGGQPGATGLDGNAILGQIFGAKDVSRNVAGAAAQESGLDSSLLKQMLPLIASAAVMLLSQRGQSGAQPGGLGDALGGGRAPAGAGQGSLASMLDFDGDGSAVDDMLDLARKFF
jgi:hypothetical protein